MSRDDITELTERVGLLIVPNPYVGVVCLIPTPAAVRSRRYPHPTFPFTPDDAIAFANHLIEAAEFAKLRPEDG